MKKILKIIIMVSISAMVISFNINAYAKTKKEDIGELLASLPNEKIYLYGILNAQRGIYENFTLFSGNQRRLFRWENITGWAPKLFLRDINNDKKNELIIIVTQASGTNLAIEKAHVLDTNELTEYLIEDPIVAVLKNVTDRITPKGIEIKINNKKILIKEEKIQTKKENRYPRLAYGNWIKFYVEDNELIANVGAAIGPAENITGFKVRFEYNNSFFQAKSVEILEG